MLEEDKILWQQRVIDEKAELDKKIKNLSVFLGKQNEATASERVRLHTQLGLMEQYSRVLSERIAEFK
jgi:hypothetical protein